MTASMDRGNLNVLNRLRRERGLTTFSLRPHSGEAGDIDHMVTTFLLAEAINHGITMRTSATLQYLHYIEQIGLAVSPMSNNALFLQVCTCAIPLLLCVQQRALTD